MFKKIILISVCFMTGLFSLFSCKSDKPNNNTASSDVPESKEKITFVNEIGTADIWVIPDTKENRSTTLWGTASLKELESGNKGEISLSAGDGIYLIRVIDSEKMYYAADDVNLRDGYTVTLRAGEEAMSFFAEITDEQGGSSGLVQVFAARL